VQESTRPASHFFSWFVLQAIGGIQAHLMTMVHLHRLRLCCCDCLRLVNRKQLACGASNSQDVMSSKRNPQLAAALNALLQKRYLGSLGSMVLRLMGKCIWMSQSSYLGNAAGRYELQLHGLWLCKSSR